MRRGMVRGHTVRLWEEIWFQLTQNLHKVCAKCCNVQNKCSTWVLPRVLHSGFWEAFNSVCSIYRANF